MTDQSQSFCCSDLVSAFEQAVRGGFRFTPDQCKQMAHDARESFIDSCATLIGRGYDVESDIREFVTGEAQ